MPLWLSKGPVLKDVEKANNDNICHVFSTIPTEGFQNTPQAVCDRSTTPKNVIICPGALPGLTAFSIFFFFFPSFLQSYLPFSHKWQHFHKPSALLGN